MEIENFFEENKNVTVALSGGVDSAVLLCLAKKYAENVSAVFVKTEFQPEFERADAEEICKSLGVELNVISTSVIKCGSITQNNADRCYHCKGLIFSHICDYAKSRNAVAIEGTNADDDISDRPGYKALGELGVLSPLKICGYTKADIRKIAAENNLSVKSKPSYACLATRIPTGTEITAGILSLTEKAEGKLFEYGFSDFRIRYRNGGALLELTAEDRERYISNKSEIDNSLLKYYNKISLSKGIRNGTGKNQSNT